jgi:hypothetical protein
LAAKNSNTNYPKENGSPSQFLKISVSSFDKTALIQLDLESIDFSLNELIELSLI